MRWLPLLAVALTGCGKSDDGQPSCEAMAAHVNVLLGEDAEARQLQKSFEARCTEDRWSKGMRECLMKTTSTDKPQGCRTLLDDTQQQRWDAMLAETAAASAAVLPQVCEVYAALVQRAQQCEAFSPKVRADLVTSLKASQDQWAKMPNKTSLVGTCGGAIRSLRSASPDCFK